MNKRLPEVQRIALEARLKVLREVTAALEPGKVSGIVDKVSPEQTDIKSVIESIMKVMEAEPEAAKYHTAKKARTLAILKKAMELADAGENPEEEAMDFKDPAMHMAEDLEHEVQTMDDHRLIQEVQQLEEHMKQDLAKMSPTAPAVAQTPPAAAPAEKLEEPKAEEAPEEDEKEMKPEHKLALLMSLPKAQRLAKAAKLKALAGVLEGDTHEVSQDNELNRVDSSPALMKDYETEEDGSMKDVKATALKATVRQLLAALDDSTEEKDKSEEEDKKDESMDKEAVLKLALKHLYASIEDMQEAKEDKSDDKEDLDESEGGKPNFLQEAEEKAEAKEDKEPSMEERKAILKARLASMKRSATVDGKTMKTPKEVPTSSGTTEDNLKGDAKIQYSTSNAEDGLDVIKDRRDPVKHDKSMAGTDEPNAIYMSNNPGKDRYEPTMESDSSKDVNNKRVLKDEGTAVQKSTPSSPTEGMEMGEGSHTKTKDWEKAKSESDTTPSGDRLVGLAQMNEIIKIRTDRAVKLAGKMADLGLIKTEAQLGEKIAELASMDDSQFTVVASFLSSNLTKETVRTRPSRVAAEMPVEHDEDEDEDDEKDDEKMEKKEAGLVRRASARSYEDEDEEETSVRRASTKTRRAERGGLKTPLMSGTESIINHRASTITRGGSDIADALSKVAWTDPKVEARKKADLDEYFDNH